MHCFLGPSLSWCTDLLVLSSFLRSDDSPYEMPPSAIVICHSSMFSRSICQCQICCQCPICCHRVSCFCYMPLPYVQPFDLPVVDLLPFDLLRPDLLPPCVVLLFRLHLLHMSPLLGRRTSFYTMILSSLLLRNEFILHDDLEFIAPPPFTKDFRVCISDCL